MFLQGFAEIGNKSPKREQINLTVGTGELIGALTGTDVIQNTGDSGNAGVVSQAIRVISGVLVFSGSGTLVIESDSVEVHRITVGGPQQVTYPPDAIGYFQSAKGEALDYTLTGEITVTGVLNYIGL